MSQDALIDAFARARLEGDLIAVATLRDGLTQALNEITGNLPHLSLPEIRDRTQAELDEHLATLKTFAQQAERIREALALDEQFTENVREGIPSHRRLAKTILRVTPEVQAMLGPEGHAEMMAAGFDFRRYAVTMRMARACAKAIGAHEDAALFQRVADHADALAAGETRN